MGLNNMEDVIDSPNILKNKKEATENQQVQALYAKVFEPTFDDKKEYHLLMK